MWTEIIIKNLFFRAISSSNTKIFCQIIKISFLLKFFNKKCFCCICRYTYEYICKIHLCMYEYLIFIMLYDILASHKIARYLSSSCYVQFTWTSDMCTGRFNIQKFITWKCKRCILYCQKEIARLHDAYRVRCLHPQHVPFNINPRKKRPTSIGWYVAYKLRLCCWSDIILQSEWSYNRQNKT